VRVETLRHRSAKVDAVINKTISPSLARRVDDDHDARTMARKIADRVRSLWCLNVAIDVLSTGVSDYARFQLIHVGLPLPVSAVRPPSRHWARHEQALTIAG